MTDLGVVAIGRNEGDRLRRCLVSLAPAGVPVVYVDSGSTDGSAALARGLGVEVVELDPSRPFSAARARNEGFDRLASLALDLRYAMFVDGDCEVVPGWLEAARAELEARPELAVVCGRRRESDPGRSIYNRLADLEWDTPIGLAEACGGDALFRADDFRAVGGFDPTAKAGEEPDLCRRLRARGRLVARIDREMTRHDLNMTRFAQWWRRQFRVGYHGLDLRLRLPPGPIRAGSPFGAQLRRAWAWGLGWPCLVALGMVAAGSMAGAIGALLALGAGVGVLAAQAGRVAWRVRRRVARPKDALAHGALMVVEKWANLAGQAVHVIDRRRGRAGQLIEYKAAPR